jgi:RES domain-containing protein
MRLYRLAAARYATDLSGRGAEIAGGRWNSKGIAMLYTSTSRALCTTEIAVHTPLGIVPKDYMLITVEVPDRLKIGQVGDEELPEDWNAFPHRNSTQLLGDAFIQAGKWVGIRVPSAVVQGEYNYVFNPRHPDFSAIKITGTEPFRFDERLFVKKPAD